MRIQYFPVFAALIILQAAICSKTFGEPTPRIQSNPKNLNELTEAYTMKMKARAAACQQKCEKINEDGQKEQEKRNDDMEEEGKKTKIQIKGRWEMAREDWNILVPEVAMREDKIAFDVPTLTTQRQGVKIDVPVIVMRRVPGPDIKYGSIEWRNDGIFGTPSPTYHEIVQHTSYDLPTLDSRLQEYTWDMPVVSGTQRTEISVMIPHVTMKPQHIAFSHPVFISEKAKIGSDKEVLDKQQKESEDAVAKTQSKVVAASNELKAGLKQDFLWYAPQLLLFQSGAATEQIDTAAKASQESLRKALTDDIQLRNARVAAGAKERVATQYEINKQDYLLATYTTSANAALYEAYANGVKELQTQGKDFGATEQELFDAVVSWGLGSQLTVDYTIKHDKDGTLHSR